jgi:hypothetical protein
MPCPLFDDRRPTRCTAVRGCLIPSLHERERWCVTDGWARCPTYRTRAQREEALPEEVYWTLWLPWTRASRQAALDEAADTRAV